MSTEEAQDFQVEQAQARHLHAFLKTAIAFGALAGGAAITVGALARRHRVSDEAARDALRQLEDEGLVGRESQAATEVSVSGEPQAIEPEPEFEPELTAAAR